MSDSTYPDPNQQYLIVYISGDELDRINHAASNKGQLIREWAREALIDQARNDSPLPKEPAAAQC